MSTWEGFVLIQISGDMANGVSIMSEISIVTLLGLDQVSGNCLLSGDAKNADKRVAGSLQQTRSLCYCYRC